MKLQWFQLQYPMHYRLLDVNDTSDDPSVGLNVMGIGLTSNEVAVTIPTLKFLSLSTTVVPETLIAIFAVH